ncbi:hypothetical protein NIES37_08230 [Tolypothrix tenuis PCC 7101]|uniref:Alpha/beta hydrolase n=1 Tax=Tolypothrix tenuis PCC 7101 TaxID=231146 RepID=A0A1Z4MTU7_9CYAN|nr:hypothetical protein [Aulosira sp. FACHB-113]BAY96886.1 hypothetical protein NIES37_08230 [Tolypothrix tenuis PCC 7101]BAZ72606.1 hypothetical protein NIES50_11600 [Aulosira laxa NIES-50]
MDIIICPGIHEPELTESFISGCFNLNCDRAALHPRGDRKLAQNPAHNILIFPEQGVLTVSPFKILQFLHNCLKDRLQSPVFFISFSAGVVGAIIAARLWQLLGGTVTAFIAVDGWGVPLWGDFPIHRMSHDYFTHWSSSLLGSGHNNFYAEPAVDHLSLWRSPQTVQGVLTDQSLGLYQNSDRLSASDFVHLLLKRYEEK